MKELDAFLQKLEKGGTLTKWGEKIMKVVVAVVVVIVLLILAQIGMFVGMFNWLEGVVRATTGLDAMLAKAIAFLFLALLFGTPLGGFAWSFLPVPRKDKKKKRFIFLAVLSILFFGAYFASRDVYFDPATGEPVKYYSVDANGEYKFSSSGGYDPVTGEALRPVSGEVTASRYTGRSVQVRARQNSGEPEVYNLPGHASGESPAEMYENKYLVKFRNEQNRGIFLCFTEGHNAFSGTTVILIPTKKTISVRLSEGVHKIAFLDTEFNEYGHRKGGAILNGTFTDTLSGKLYLSIGNREKIVGRYFELQVLAMNKQKVTLKENELVTHNKEMSGGEKNTALGVALIGAGVFFLFVFLGTTKKAEETVVFLFLLWFDLILAGAIILLIPLLI